MHFPAARNYVTCVIAPWPLPAAHREDAALDVHLGCRRAAGLSSLPLKGGDNLHTQRVTNSLPELSAAKVRSAHGATPHMHSTPVSSCTLGQELLPWKENSGCNEYAKH